MLLLECVDWLYSSHKPVNMLWWNHIPYTNVQRWNDTLWAWVHLLMPAGQLFNSNFCLHLPSFFCAAWKWETTHKWTMQVICMSSNVLDSRELPAPWSIQTKWKPLGYITKYMELFQNWLTFINWVEPSQCGKFTPNWRSYYMQHCCPESGVELIAES